MPHLLVGPSRRGEDGLERFGVAAFAVGINPAVSQDDAPEKIADTAFESFLLAALIIRV